MKTNTTFKVFGFILAVALVLFGGIGITGAAAQSAIPGDALYPVKTTIENTRLSMAQDAGDRAQMKLTFAEQRLTEISSLIREGRYREIREAVLAFEGSINAAVMELETVSASDPARAALITQEVTSALTRYAQMLSELAAIAPDSIKPEVNRALDTTHIASGLGQAAGNENTNANDNSSVEDGSVNANDNGGSNSNDNASDYNSNSNANDNGDDNSNASGNSNDNSADDNANADDNGNDNGADDNSNGSADDNSSVDDNGGSANNNGSADDNSNDNGSADNSNDDSSGGNSGSDDNSNDDNSGKGGGSDDGGGDNSGKGKGGSD